MKKMTVAQRTRWIAGGLYILLCVYQMFIAQAVIQGASLSNAYFTWLYAIFVIPAAGAMALWMFSSKEILSAGARRAVVVGTGLMICFELITYSEQTSVIDYMLYSVLPSLYGKPIYLYLFMILQMMLMILAAFFVTSCRSSMDYMPGDAHDDDKDDDKDADDDDDDSDDEAEDEATDEPDDMDEVLIEIDVEEDTKK